MDDIRERATDARILWKADRRDGAFLLALVCVAVRAKLEHPEVDGDRERFEEFVRSKMPARISVEFRGGQEPLEHVFYKWMRCALVHDAAFPEDLHFLETDDPNTLSLRAGGAPEYKLLIAPGWFDELLRWATD